MSARRGRAAAAAAIVLVATPTAARAFSELGRFAEPAVDGGGEGRYFTGAPPDGLACGVCHAGGAAPPITVDGLPERIVAGTRYQLAFRWPADGRDHALAVELVDGGGRHPAVTLPPPGEQPAAMRCADPPAASAATAVDVGGRRVIAVAPCGAHALALAFTPATDAPLYLGAALVAADGSETADGDGVVELRRTLTADGGGCSAGGRPGLAAALAALALVLARPRRSGRPATSPRRR